MASLKQEQRDKTLDWMNMMRWKDNTMNSKTISPDEKVAGWDKEAEITIWEIIVTEDGKLDIGKLNQ